MLSKPSSMISISLSRSSSSISRSLPRCRLTLSRTLGSSRSSRDHLITSLRSVSVASPTNWSSRCTAGFLLLVKWWSATRAMWRKCISLGRDLLKSTTMKLMSVKGARTSPFCIYQSTPTSVTTKSSTTWSLTSCSRLSSTVQKIKSTDLMSQCQISSSCASIKRSSFSSAISSRKQRTTLREGLLKEDKDSWRRGTQTQKDISKSLRLRRTCKEITARKCQTSPRERVVTSMKRPWTTSTQMRNQKTSRARRKIWSNILISWIRESTH